MDRLLVVSLALSALGLGTLGALGHLWKAPDVALDDLARWEGQRICVQARVAHLRPTEGATRFSLASGEHSLGAWARFQPTLVPGDQVRACGTLARTSAGFELRPQRPADVTVVETWDATLTPLPVLADRPWEFEGRSVAVIGRLVRDGGSLFLLDPPTNARIRASAGDDAATEAQGRAEGVVEYDPERTQFRLRIRSFTT